MTLQTERTIPTKKKLRSTTKREGEGGRLIESERKDADDPSD